METSALYYWTLTEVAERIRRKDLSPVDATRALLDRINALDPQLRGYVTVLPEAALQGARQAEREIAAGQYRGPLHGVPLAVKDLCFTQGTRTTCGSRLLADWIPDRSATVVEKLREAGAVILGKLALTEFACGGYPPPFRPPVNPWGVNCWAGASSSGSAAATAAGLCFGSLGTDTGGSIRNPSAVCGVVGIKPTYGRVSRHGVFPLAQSLDHVGPMARSVSDAAVLLHAIAGFDPHDPTTRREPVPDYSRSLVPGIPGTRIGVDADYCTKVVHPEVSAAVSAATKRLGELGATVREVSIPPIDEALDAFWVLLAAEAAAAHEHTFPSRAAEYGTTTRTLLEEGHRVRGLDYAKAHAVRQTFCHALGDVFRDVDLLACPSFNAPTFALDLVPPDAVIDRQMLLPAVRFSAPYNLSGSPTISVPCGFTADGLPISLQLIGRHMEEELLCQTAHAYERATAWHQRHPAL